MPEDSLTHTEIIKTVKNTFKAWPRLKCGTKVSLIFFIFFLSPFIIQCTVVSLILGLLIPIAFVLEKIEHHIVILWSIIVLFINMGGILDLLSDIILIGRIYLNDVDRSNIALARTITTVITIVPGIFIYIIVRSNILAEVYDEEKVNKEKNTTGTHPGILLMCIVYKLLMLVLRVGLTFYVLVKMIASRGKLSKGTKKNVQFMEMFLVFDLLCSGIPLGVITVLELFVINKEDTPHASFMNDGGHDGGFMHTMEYLKLAALFVDMIAACYFIYYVVYGLGDHHEENHEEKQLKNNIEDPLLTNKNE